MHMVPWCVDSPIEDGVTEISKLRYFGDLVIDIDHGKSSDTEAELVPAIEASIKSANQIIEWFAERCDPAQLTIWASGKKGFHIVIPAKLIHSGKAMIRGLPLIYKEMVNRIEIDTGATGIDKSLYAQGRGHTVRIPNKRRPEGTYKVEVSVRDMALMTYDRYQQLVAAPRPLLKHPALATSIPLMSMFNLAKAQVENYKEDTTVTGLADEDLAEFGTDQHPECISRLVNWEKVNPEVNYNRLAMQLAIYLRAASVPADTQGLMVKDFARNGHSSSYDTPEKRERHLTIQVAPSTKNTPFSCGAMRSSVDMKGACGSCPIYQKREADSATLSRVLATDAGYSITNRDGEPRKLTNFILDIQNFNVPKGLRGRSSEAWTSGVASIHMNGRWSQDVEFRRDAFESAKEFKSTFGVLKPMWMVVNDNDVMQIKTYICNLTEGMNGMKPTNSVGLRRHSFIPDGSDTPETETVWVEPGWSISSSGLTSTLRLIGDVEWMAKHEHRQSPRRFTPEYNKTMLHLLGCSEPKVVGMLLGWVIAAQVREYIFQNVKEFPLLNVEGVSGAGKTKTVALFAALSSADYLTNTPPVVSGMTPVPMRMAGTSSTSVVRVLDECTKPKLPFQKWIAIREILKASSQQSTVQTGTIKGKTVAGEHGAGIIHEKVTSPMAFLSTCEVDEPEIWNRSIIVKLNKNLHRVREYGRNFTALNNNPNEWQNLFAIARIIMLDALYLAEEPVMGMFTDVHEKMSDMLDSRIRNMYTWVFTGLTYMSEVVDRCGGSEEVAKKLDSIHTETWGWFTSNMEGIHTQKNRNEIDIFFERLGQAAAKLDSQDRPCLRKGLHYIRDQDVLYLQMGACFTVYLVTCRWLGQNPEFNSAEALEQAMQHEEYFLGKERRGSVMGGPVLSWVKVNVPKLEGRDHDCGRFEE